MKKQIAVLMAAATAVTTVAPVIAGAEVNDKGNVTVKSIVETVEKALTDFPKDFTGVKKWSKSNKLVLYYAGNGATELAKKSGFAKFENNGAYINKDYTLPEINGTATDAGQWVIVTDAAALDRELVNVVSDSVRFNSANVAIINRNLESNGATEKTSDFQYLVVENSENGTSVTLSDLAKNIVKKYKDVPANAFVKSADVVYKDGNKETIVAEKKAIVEEGNITKTVKEITVKFVGGTRVTYRAYDSVPNLDEALNKEGVSIKTTSGDLSADILKTIVKFGNVDANGEVEVPVRTGDAELYSVVGYEKSTYTVKDFYTKDVGYTKVAADFINSLISADKNNTTFNLNGVTYQVETGAIKAAAKKANIKLVDGVYTATLNFDAMEYNNPEIKRKLAVVVEDKNLSAVQTVLSNIENYKELIVGSFVRLVGENRYKTAIEVSKQQFGNGKADTVVIVGGEAIYDGLTAAPFAQTKNAPILLANPKTGLDESTMSEIERVSKNLYSKTVYIVGGTNSVPASVEKQLVEKFGVVVRRFAGNTRVGTSNRVAEQILNEGNSNGRIFFVGYNGQADAMSVSSVAAYSTDIARQSNALENAMTALNAAKANLEVSKKEKEKAEQAYNDKVTSLKSGAVTEEQIKSAIEVYLNNQKEEADAKKAAEKFLADNKVKLESFKDETNNAYTVFEGLVNTAVDKISDSSVNSPGIADGTQVGSIKTELDKIDLIDAELKSKADKGLLEDAKESVKAYLTKVYNTKDSKINAANSVTEDMIKGALEEAKALNDINDKILAETVKESEAQKSVEALKLAKNLDVKVGTTKKVSPIMVLQKDGVDQYTRELIKRFDMTEGYVIGGLNTVSANAFRAVKTRLDGREYNLSRIFGVDRYETNLNIIKKFFGKNGITVKGGIFASGNDKYLVDAQTAGTFAASKNAPIILTADKLTKDQNSYLLNKNGILKNIEGHASDYIFQVGGVVSSDVMKSVVESLGL